METDEEIYVNIQELSDCSTKHQGPEENETKPVRTHAVAKVETETWSPLKGSAVCLGLLCLMLLTAVIAVGVQYNKDFSQLSRELANHTAQRDQLLTRYLNLTDERDQLQTSFTNAKLELNKMKKKIGTCPDGWRQFDCSCYFLYVTKSTWNNGRQVCLSHGADLVIINSRREMVFLNGLGTYLKFWIGLKKSPNQGDWLWTDGRSLATEYWRYYYPYRSFGSESCAAFNHFHSEWSVQSWSREDCTQLLQYMCEKPAEMSPLSH